MSATTGQTDEQPRAEATEAPERPHDITDVLDHLTMEEHGECISIGEVVASFDGRSHGPLLMLPGLFVMMPTGLIPGVPSLMAIFTMIVGIQMMITRKKPWLPKRMRDRSLEREQVVNAVERIRPYAEKAERFIKHRLSWASGYVAQYAAAAVCVALAPTMVVFEFLPPGAFVPGTAIFLFGLGMTARDGLITLIAFAMAATGFGLLFWATDTIF